MLAEKNCKPVPTRADSTQDVIFPSVVILACLLVLAWQFYALWYWVPEVREMGTVVPLTPDEIAGRDWFQTTACLVPALFFLVMIILGVLESVWSVKGKRLRIGLAWIGTVVLALFGIVFSFKLWIEGMVS